MPHLDQHEARQAYRELCENYCIKTPAPENEAAPRLAEIALRWQNRVDWVRVFGPWGAEQDIVDRALYGA